MSKFLNIPTGDYTIKVQEGGRILLDTGSDSGNVTITGDLIVLGETTSVNTTELYVEDNLVVVGRPNPAPDNPTDGILSPDNYAGIDVYRGSGKSAFLVYDENLSDPARNVAGGEPEGLWRFGVGTVRGANFTKGVYIDSIFTGGDELLIRTQDEPIRVLTDISGYENTIINYDGSGNVVGLQSQSDNILVNTKALVDWVDFNFASVFLPQIGAGTVSISSITIQDEEDGIVPESQINFDIDGNNIANFYDNRFEFGDLRIIENQIETIVSNEDLILSAPGTGSVRVDDTLHINSVPGIDDASAENLSPLSPNDGAKIYVSEEYTGGTGIYFVNSNETRDELISKNKAFVYSMIF